MRRTRRASSQGMTMAVFRTRYPARGACEQALTMRGQPSWLEPWVVTAGPVGGGPVSWVDANRGFVASRHVSAPNG